MLSAADVIAVAGSNGLLYMDNLTSALPLITSCQMDPSCALATTVPVGDPADKPPKSEVGSPQSHTGSNPLAPPPPPLGPFPKHTHTHTHTHTHLTMVSESPSTPPVPLLQSSQTAEVCAVFSQVELWMALVATFSFLLIPFIGMGLVFVVGKNVNPNHAATIISIGNCLSAGLIFSLGIMHVIPETVETMFKASQA